MMLLRILSKNNESVQAMKDSAQSLISLGKVLFPKKELYGAFPHVHHLIGRIMEKKFMRGQSLTRTL